MNNPTALVQKLWNYCNQNKVRIMNEKLGRDDQKRSLSENGRSDRVCLTFHAMLYFKM